MQWRQIPFVRLGLPMMIGAAGAINCDLRVDLSKLLFAYAGAALLLFGLHLTRAGYAQRWIFGLVLNIALFLFAFCNGIANHETNWSGHFSEYLTLQNYISGEVKEIKQIKKTERLVLEVKEVLTPDRTPVATCGRLLVYIPEPGSAGSGLSVGDRLLLEGRIRPIPGPMNPGAFDFRYYMHIQNVHFQAFVRPGSWMVAPKGRSWTGLWAVAKEAQARLVETLSRHLVSIDERAVGAALILGFRDFLERDLREAYAGTGAMHVLAVSGLHVGLVFLGLNILLGVFNGKGRVLAVCRILFLLAGIWGFAFVTGASASVMRAATMLSFFVLGKAAGRHCNIYNILAASAFLLLLLNPLSVGQVGFQLSYAALFGIVYLQPKIYQLYFVRNPVLDYVWKLLALSIAAQVTTLPLSLFYFHQFPVYFWLSGIIVVPAATLILAFGLFTLLFSFWPSVAGVFGTVLLLLVRVTNSLILGIRALPGSLVDNVFFPAWLLIPVSVLLIGGLGFLEKRRLQWAYLFFLALLIILCWDLGNEYYAWHRREAVVYHLRREGIIDLYDGKTLYTYEYRQNGEPRNRYDVENLRNRRDVHSRIALDALCPVVEFGGTTLLIGRDEVLASIPDTLSVEYVVLTGNPQIRLADLLQKCRPGWFIFDASNSYRTVRRWQRECEEADLKCHNVYEDGAFVIQFTP